MAQILCTLTGLEKRQKLFSAGIEILEKSTANKKIDTKLVVEIINNTNQVMKALKLITSDTTGEELYYSLLSLIQNKDQNKILNGKEFTLKQVNNKIISFNKADLKQNSQQKNSFARQGKKNGQKMLREEIMNRYRKNSVLSNRELSDVFQMMGLLQDKN